MADLRLGEGKDRPVLKAGSEKKETMPPKLMTARKLRMNLTRRGRSRNFFKILRKG